MRLQIKPELIVFISKQDAVFVTVSQHGNHNTVNIITEVSLNVRIGESGLHRIDRSHQSCLLICWIAILNNILDNRTQLCISALLQPVGQTASIEIALRQSLVLEQQRNQLMNIVSNDILVRIDNKALIAQQG